MRTETRRQRYNNKINTAQKYPISIATVNFMCDENLAYVVRTVGCFGLTDVHVIGSIPDFNLIVSILLTVLVADYLIHVGHLLQMLPSASAYSAVVHFVIPRPLLIFSNIACSSTLALISSNSSFNSSHIAS